MRVRRTLLWWIAATALGSAAAAAPLRPADEAYTRTFLQDRARVQDVISALAYATDTRQWDEVRQLLADRVDLSYTAADGSVSPIEAQMSPDQFVQASQAQLPGYLHTQHLISNLIVHVSGDRAWATSQVWMSHYLPNDGGEPYWIVGALYKHQLVRSAGGWKISGMQVNKLYELGNRQLQAIAAKRVKAGQSSAQP